VFFVTTLALAYMSNVGGVRAVEGGSVLDRAAPAASAPAAIPGTVAPAASAPAGSIPTQ